MKKILSLLFCSAACTSMYAQTVMEEKEDSTIINLRNEFLETQPSKAPISNNLNPDLPAIENTLDVPKMNWQGIPSPLLPSLPSWRTGYLSGHSSSSSNMMLGGITSSGVAIYQSLGRYWTISAGVDVTKYGVAYNKATFNGSVIYRMNRNFSITMFGGYSPDSFLSPMPIGQAWYAGGYMSLETDSHWGIDLGSTHSYDAYYGHETTPIIRPYYNLNGAKLGIDFGPMLRQFMNNNGRSNEMKFNPVMPRPMNGLPPVAPRR